MYYHRWFNSQASLTNFIFVKSFAMILKQTLQILAYICKKNTCGGSILRQNTVRVLTMLSSRVRFLELTLGLGLELGLGLMLRLGLRLGLVLGLGLALELGLALGLELGLELG